MCDSPQYTIDGGVQDCGICFSCTKVKLDADRQRRLYWLKRNRRSAHSGVRFGPERSGL